MLKVFPKRIKNDKTFSFYDDDTYHILKVLRLSIGDKLICIFDNNKYLTKIISIDPLISEIENRLDTKKEVFFKIDIFQSIIKSKNMEMTIQKATEMNIDNFYPVLFNRSQKNNLVDFENNIRLQKIVKSASKQSSRYDFMHLHKSINFNEMCKKLNDYDLIIVPYENQKEEYIQKKDFENVANVAIIIGPEGGFSSNEISQLEKMKNVKIIKLTKTILKSETACIYTTAIVLNFLLSKDVK